MIARPSTVADHRYRPLIVPDASAEAVATDAFAAAGLDPAIAVRNVVRRGGRERVFRAALGAGVAALGSDEPGTREELLELVSLAGWRSGVLALRDHALIACEVMQQGDRAGTAAAVLGIEASELAEFVERQVVDRYWWPGRAASNGYAWSVGGFAGFGDAWIEPADAWQPLEEPGAFAIRVAGAWWRADGDVWGARLAPLAGEVPGGAATQPPSAPVVSIVLRPATHLAWLHVRDSE